MTASQRMGERKSPTGALAMDIEDKEEKADGEMTILRTGKRPMQSQ